MNVNDNDIEIMTHEQAVKIQAVERYFLGELTDEQRDAFEAHYFDCKECFDQVQLSQDFQHHAHAVMEDEPARAPEPGSKPSWLAALLGDFRRPAMAFVSAMLLFAVGTGLYQHSKIVSLKAPRVETTYMLAGESRGAAKLVEVSRNSTLSLRVEFSRKPEFVSYKAQIVSESRKVKDSLPIPSDQTDESVTVSLPASTLDPGNYALVVLGVTADGTQTAVGSGSFELKFTN